MTIKVQSNPNANAVNFIGSSNSTFWNAHLEGEVNSEDNTRINVINKISGTADAPIYEFWAIPFEQILDKNGNAFASADSAASYITAECNLVLGDGTLEVGLTNSLDFSLDGTSTTIIVSDGRTYAANTLQAYEQTNGLIGILPKFGVNGERTPLYSDIYISNLSVEQQGVSGTTTSVINFLNGIFSVQALGAGGTSIRPTFTYEDAVDIAFTTFGSNTSWDSNGGAGLVRTATLSGSANFREGGTTDQRISTAGSYFEWKQRSNHGIKNSIGLIRQENIASIQTSNRSHDHSDLNLQINSNILRSRTTDRDTPAPIKDKGFVRGEILQTPRTWRAGLNADRRLYIGYFDDFDLFVDVGRSANPVLEEDSYALVGFLRNTGVLDFDSCKVYNAIDEAAEDTDTLNLSYRFIESPDGSFHFPLFATAEEANQYDSAQGGSGASSTQVYVDEPTSATWFSPSTGFTTGGASAPTDSGEVVYNSIPTNDDGLYAPSGFGTNSATVNEGAGINVQVVPAGATGFTTTIVDNDGLGVSLNGQYVEGTAPQISGNNVDNPSDDFTVTVRRTNAYGSTDGTLTVTVNNLTAPAVAISGFTHDTNSRALIDSDTLDSGSVVSFDNTLDRPYRTYIRQAWVETNVLPNLTDSGDQIFVGIVDSSGEIATSSVIDSDFLAWTCWEYGNGVNHINTIGAKGHSSNLTTINSATDAFYDYAFEADDEDELYVIACNINDISTQPGVSHGGDFSRWRQVQTDITGKGPFTISATPISTTMDISVDSDISEIVIPVAPRWIQVTDSAGAYLFDDSATMPTLSAGYTYRFLMADVEWANQTDSTNLDASEVLRFYKTGTDSEVTTGITRDGAVGSEFAYVEFALDSAIEPTKWAVNDSAGAATGITISGSSYVAPASSGVTQEGPSANQTGDNFFNNGEKGWLSLDDTITAGQRLVLNSTFLQDLVDGMPDNTSVAFGIKDPNWTDAVTGLYSANFTNQFIGGAFIRVTRFPSVNSNRVKIYAGIAGTGTNASQTIAFSYGTTIDTDASAFIEISADGDQVNCGIHNILSEGNAASTPFAFWPEGGSTYDPPRKFTTGDQGYNISTADVMMIGGHASQGSTLGGAMAYDAVDWSLLSEINVPSLPTAITTNYAKALDFSGGSEYAKQTGSNNSYAPLRMSGFSTAIAAGTWNGSLGNTSSATSARPWAVTCVFKSDGNSSNQHIWNQGEGSATGDDNIYVRVSSTGQLFFGWGRIDALNELYLGTISSSNWYGVYVASTGERLTGNNASATNLAGCFDIRLFSSATGWGMSEQLSTYTNWNASPSITGGRMDRTFAGDFTVGGRSNNRNFHGKIASCVVTTLRRGFTMPKSIERKMMTIDPKQWMTDYRVGKSYRQTNSGSNGTWSLNNQNSSYATQVWLMGDGTNDAYSKIRNQAWPANQNNTTLDMNSMVSNDIETIDVDGLTD